MIHTIASVCTFALLSVAVSRPGMAAGCGSESLRLEFPQPALQSIQVKSAIFENAMREARAKRWGVRISDQASAGFTLLDKAEAQTFKMAETVNRFNHSNDINALLFLVLMESSRQAHADLRDAVQQLDEDDEQQRPLKQDLVTATGLLGEMEGALVNGYRQALRSDVHHTDRQVTIPKRIYLLDTQTARMTTEAPIGGVFIVNVSCTDEAGAPLQVRVQLRNLLDGGADVPVPTLVPGTLDVRVQANATVDLAALMALEVQATEPVPENSLSTCFIRTTQDRLLSQPPEPVTPQKRTLLQNLLNQESSQLKELRALTRDQLSDPRSAGSEDAVKDVLVSQVDRYNRFARINALGDIAMLDLELKAELDVSRDWSDIVSQKMQMMMDRRSKFISVLSNILKKISSTQDAITQNLK